MNSNMCLICGSAVDSASAVIAPFIALRALQPGVRTAKYHRCQRCGFGFFEPRLDDAAQARLYHDYRGGQYLQERMSCEPWYSAAFNAALSEPSGFIRRRRAVRSVFAEHLKTTCPRGVLDFGGDKGDLVTDLIPGARPFVYDISGVLPRSGVTRVESLSECRDLACDVIVCSSVLEHVPDPIATLHDIDSISTPTTLIYVEVPDERPSSALSRLKRVVQYSWLSVARPKIAFRMLRKGMFTVLHEHVNFFTADSLLLAANALAWEVVASGHYTLSSASGMAFGTERCLWMLVQQKSKST